MRRFGLIAVFVLTGCPDHPGSVPDAAVEPADAGAPPIDAGRVDAGPPAPTELMFPIDFLGTDGGVTTVASNAGTAQIEPAKAVFIRFPVPLKDYRVRFFDGAEQVLPSDEEARVEDGGMTYQVQLAAPLKAGRSYAFGVDSELGHEILDVTGHGYRDVRLTLKVKGTPEPEPKAGKSKKKRKK